MTACAAATQGSVLDHQICHSIPESLEQATHFPVFLHTVVLPLCGFVQLTCLANLKLKFNICSHLNICKNVRLLLAGFLLSCTDYALSLPLSIQQTHILEHAYAVDVYLENSAPGHCCLGYTK